MLLVIGFYLISEKHAGKLLLSALVTFL